MSTLVFDIICSMSQAEKRYFRRYSTLHSETKENKYVQLFDYMDGAKQYDASALKVKLGAKYYAQEKRHLYTKLLDALREFHKNKGAEANSSKLIAYHLLLLDKGLTQQAAKELEKAKMLAIEKERHYDLIKLMQMETGLLREETDLNILDSHLLEQRRQLSVSMLILDKELQYEQEYLNIVKWNKEIEFARTERELKALRSILSKPIFKEEPITISTKSRIYFHYTKGLFYFFNGAFNESISHFEQQLNLFHAYPHTATDHPKMYARSIGNYCLLNIKLGDEAKCIMGLNYLKTMPFTTLSTAKYSMYLEYMLGLMLPVKINQYEKAISHIETHSVQFNLLDTAYKEWYLEWVYVCFNSVAAYMGIGEYKLALKHLNHYLNTADPNLKQDVYCIGRVVNLLIHFELNNRDLLEYILESTYKYLKGKNRLFGFEKAIISFIKASLNAGLESERKNLFASLRKQLVPLKNDRFEKNVFEYFDFIGWIDRTANKNAIN